MTELIKLTHICKSYSGFSESPRSASKKKDKHANSFQTNLANPPIAVLKDIQLSVSDHEQIAIMGSSGSGKTTLINILGLLDTATSGTYRLNGKDVSDLDQDARALLRNQLIGFIFQSFYLLPRLNILENVALPLYYRGVVEAERKERAQIMLQKVGLATLTYRKPNQLSGGQQQRVAIARALVGNPKFILADEPTGSLDSKTGELIMDLFKQLRHENKVAIIVVTHDAQIAAQCERILVIRNGEIEQNSSR